MTRWARWAELKAAYRRLDYRFDELMAGGAKPLLVLLAAVTAASVIVVSALLVWTDVSRTSFGDQVYRSLRPMFPGLFDSANGRPPYLIASVLLAILGLLLVSVLVATVSVRLNGFLLDLARGRSFVVETDHLAILGWSEEIYAILQQLELACPRRRREAVAVLAERDKLEMQSLIHHRLRDIRRLRIICRTGSAIDPDDIALVNPDAARTLIVLPPDGTDPDAQVIKTIMAIKNRQRRNDAKHPVIVAEIRDPQNLQAAGIAGGKDVVPINTEEIVSRLVVQVTRQPGLRLVYEELLNFEGIEFYQLPAGALAGRSFEDAVVAYEGLTVVGIREGDHVVLRPPMEKEIRQHSLLVVAAEDEDATVRPQLTRAAAPELEAIIADPGVRHLPERLLILGSNRRIIRILEEIDKCSAPGSVATVVSAESALRPLGAHGNDSAFEGRNLTVTVIDADPTDRGQLERLQPGEYRTVVVLAADAQEAQQADARTLMTLLHVRDLKQRSQKRFSVVTEILDARNAKLAEVAEVDDLIVRGKLMSYLIGQAARDRWRANVIFDLLAQHGSSIELRPAGDYVQVGRKIDFLTVTAAASMRGEIALGYYRRIVSGRAENWCGEVKLNPQKSQPLTLTEHDRLVILIDTGAGSDDHPRPAISSSELPAAQAEAGAALAGH